MTDDQECPAGKPQPLSNRAHYSHIVCGLERSGTCAVTRMGVGLHLDAVLIQHILKDHFGPFLGEQTGFGSALA